MQVVVMMLCWFTVFGATILKRLLIVLFLNFKLRAHSTILLSHAIYLSILDKSHPSFPIFLSLSLFFISLYRCEEVSFFFLVLSKLFFSSSSRIPNTFDARLTYCSKECILQIAVFVDDNFFPFDIWTELWTKNQLLRMENAFRQKKSKSEKEYREWWCKLNDKIELAMSTGW